MMQVCIPGSSVAFENVKLINKKGVEIIVPRKIYLFYPGDQPVAIHRSASFKEFMELSRRNFVSGTIYFSGANFPNVVIQQIKKNEPITLFARCGPGSIIAFENCIYQNEDGTLSKSLTKTIKLD